MSSTQNEIAISIVLPCYNEENAILAVVNEIENALKTTPLNCYEIIVIDDCSTDTSADVIKKSNIILIKNLERRGAGYSRRKGIEKSRGKIIITLDADGSYSPQDIPKLLSFFPEYDEVIGQRSCDHGNYKFLRLFIKKLIFIFTSIIVGSYIPDLNTGLRAFKRKVVIKHLNLIPNGFSCASTLSLIYICLGYKVKFVPIEYKERIGNSKFHPLLDTARLILTVIRITLKLSPYRILFLFMFMVSFMVFSKVITWALFNILIFFIFKIYIKPKPDKDSSGETNEIESNL